MGFLFRPDDMLESVADFDAADAARRGIVMVFSDLDNTLTRWNDDAVPSSARAFAARLRAHNIDLCLLSNNNAKRIEPFAKSLGVMYVASAKKPLPFSLSMFIRRRRLGKGQCALVGDQLITDMVAGNLAGVRTTLVRPIDLSHEYGGTKINRKVEAILFRWLGLRWENE